MSRHPPYLTRTERHRFIRSYYGLWGLMTLEQSSLESDLQKLSQKRLRLLHEMTILPQSMGGVEKRPPTDCPDADSHSFRAINQSCSPKRRELEQVVATHIEQRHWEVHGEQPDWPIGYALEEGFLVWVVLWDHWQESLKWIVCCRHGYGTPPCLRKDWSLWEESSDDGE